MEKELLNEMSKLELNEINKKTILVKKENDFHYKFFSELVDYLKDFENSIFSVKIALSLSPYNDLNLEIITLNNKNLNNFSEHNDAIIISLMM